MRAYDIEILKKSVTSEGPRGHGWCFGLPPGLAPAQWPLDPNNGYPLSHGFTILLPEDYRVHGPHLVALSFFATACDMNDGGPAKAREIAALFKAMPETPPADPALVPFWTAEQNRHPHLHRMTDLLNCAYAAILLTQAEFEAPFCPPPALAPNPYRDRVSPPLWLTVGAATAFWDGTSPSPAVPVEALHYFKILGDVPEKSPAFNRALRWTPRRADPNAGIPPREDYHADRGGYRSHYYWENDVIATENYRLHDWARDHKPDHIGGTMRPAQNIPDITPYYIEFEEYFGGYNFGGGNGWLDVKDMTCDWSQ